VLQGCFSSAERRWSGRPTAAAKLGFGGGSTGRVLGFQGKTVRREAAAFVGKGARLGMRAQVKEQCRRGMRLGPVRPPARCGGARKVMTGGARSSAIEER
jgi:hypothetical protein